MANRPAPTARIEERPQEGTVTMAAPTRRIRDWPQEGTVGMANRPAPRIEEGDLEGPMAALSLEKEMALSEGMDATRADIEREQDVLFRGEDDPRFRAADMNLRIVALSQYLQDFFKGWEPQMPAELEQQAPLVEALASTIVVEMDYEEAYSRFDEGNPTEKFRRALFPSPQDPKRPAAN